MNETPPPALGEWRIRVVLLTISLLVSLAGAEAALRLLGVGAPLVREGTGGFTFFHQDPRLGWDLVPGAVDRLTTPEMDVEIRITEQGLRSHSVFEPTPPPGTRRLVVIGDSFSFGHGVEVEEAWPTRLEGLLAASAPTEVINLSVTGYGTDQQLLRFEDRGMDFQPDTVILGLFVGNIFRNAREIQIGYPKPRFVLDGDELRLTNVPVPATAPKPVGLRTWHVASSGLRTVREHLGWGEAWSVTAAIIERLQQRCRELDAELFVVVLPKDRMIYGGGWRLRIHERTHRATDALLDRLGVARLDLTDALRHAAAEPETPRLYFPVDGHWTPEGHRVAAEAVAPALP